LTRRAEQDREPDEDGASLAAARAAMTIASSASPDSCFSERAAEVDKIRDGFLFSIGRWDEGAAANLGLSIPPMHEPRYNGLGAAAFPRLHPSGDFG